MYAEILTQYVSFENIQQIKKNTFIVSILF